MSRKGGSTVCSKSKQIPRIFQRRGQSGGGVGRSAWNLVDAVSVEGSNVNERARRNASPCFLVEGTSDATSDEKRRKDNGFCENVDNSVTRNWSCRGINGIVSATTPTTTVEIESPVNRSSKAAETVADIEKWLKSRTESVSSIELDSLKPGAEEEGVGGVERFLADELPHAFLGKDPDGLSIDIDLSDKKLNLGYDPILQELQSEKLLEACEKNDDFILPEFQLDHLDPLALSPEDMMVAGEILPSTSSQPALEVISKVDADSEEIASRGNRSVDTEVGELEEDFIKADIYELTEELEIREEVESGFKEVCVVNETNAEFVRHREISCMATMESCSVDNSRAKSKMEPRIMKRRAKLTTSARPDKNQITFVGDECHMETKDGIMAVVAISTDNISNMTQIVINTGKDEQIYQGKTTELIEATGNFPKLPKMDAPVKWTNGVENCAESPPSSQHELIISNALEELGITDECLQSTTTTDNGKTWLCPKEDCNREFNKIYALKGHLLAHYGVRPFKCDYEGCAWAFHSEFKLKRHKETHLKRKDFVCAVPGCNRRFTTVYNLWSHEKLHTRPNRITCQVPDCQEKFQTKRALELHMKFHDQSHAPYVCQHEGCGKRYYSSNALTSHQRCHSYKEIDVKCSWSGCGKVFDKPCRLKAHIRSHTGCKPYPCTYQDCQWAFSSSSKLKRHEKKHTNERKFVCDVDGCGKAFMRSEHLKEHSLTHKEGRYFQCYMCEARFSAKSSLYVHIKKHQVKESSGGTITTAPTCKTLKRRSKECPVENETSRAANSSNKELCRSVGELYEDSVQHGLLEENSDQQQEQENSTEDRCFVQPTAGNNFSTSLRNHVIAMPVGALEEEENADETPIEQANDASSVANMDYILYASPNAIAKVARQMVMVEPGDTIILDSCPETVSCLPEPEPPPALDPGAASSRLSQSSYSRDEGFLDSRTSSCNRGSARTGLTREDVWRLKAKAEGGVEPGGTVVGASDVVLGTSDLTEGLLLTEELPSMYYQDDMVGTECQILLLDSGTPENAINLRCLD